MVWKVQGKAALSIPLLQSSKKYSLINMLGGKEPFKINNGKMTFTGGPYPSYIIAESLF